MTRGDKESDHFQPETRLIRIGGLQSCTAFPAL
ncbi:hypothetical protein PS627_01526 [Pseudomonas fluorescens]|nr:hypothetical protein PS627_01526 [Pseudomonas fluorescens]VVP86662.1 hypothetical protein PS910_02473 [Pseudomonas fluorescens]